MSVRLRSLDVTRGPTPGCDLGITGRRYREGGWGSSGLGAAAAGFLATFGMPWYAYEITWATVPGVPPPPVRYCVWKYKLGNLLSAAEKPAEEHSGEQIHPTTHFSRFNHGLRSGEERTRGEQGCTLSPLSRLSSLGRAKLIRD